MTHRIRSTVRSRARRVTALVAAAVTVAVLAACTAQPTPVDTPEPSATSVTIPDTPVGSQAEWVLDEINAEEAAPDADVEQRFDAAVFEQLPLADLQAVLADMRAVAPWQPIGYEGSDTQARVTIESEQVTYDMTLSVTAEGSIDSLLFGMPRAERTPAASWDELREQIENADYEVSLQVTDAATGDVIEEAGESSSSPIGSVFKLWVLGAVIDAVAAGTLSWDDELVIDARVRSLPSGELQDLPDGSTVTVREAAEKMIAISDNTATDALIMAVGRDAVESAVADMGHADPAVNTPLLTTRELFWLLFDADLRALWAAAGDDEAARAGVLERLPSGTPELDASTMAAVTPGWSDGADWFAEPADIVAAHVALQERAQTDAGAPVRDILSANPGIEFGDAWSYVGFKGGSSVGVLAGSWYLERGVADAVADPVVLTVFARADDAQSVADPYIVFGWAEDAASLLAAD